MNNTLKTLAAAFCTAAGFLFGEFDGMFKALVALIVLDYVSGVAAAASEGKISSSVGARGIAKKFLFCLL